MSRTHPSHKPRTIDQRQPNKKARREALPESPKPYFSVFRTLQFKETGAHDSLNQLRWNLRNYYVTSEKEKVETVSREFGKRLVHFGLSASRHPIDAWVALKSQPIEIDDGYIGGVDVWGDIDNPITQKTVILSLDRHTQGMLRTDRNVVRVGMGMGALSDSEELIFGIPVANTTNPDRLDQMQDVALNSGLIGRAVLLGRPTVVNGSGRGA